LKRLAGRIDELRRIIIGVDRAELERAAGEGDEAAVAERAVHAQVFRAVGHQNAAAQDGVARVGIRTAQGQRAIVHLQVAGAVDGVGNRLRTPSLRTRRRVIHQRGSIVIDGGRGREQAAAIENDVPPVMFSGVEIVVMVPQ